VLWPCLFTTLTTSAGFLALVTARMPVVRDLGWFASTGVLGAFVVAVIFVLVGGSWSSVDPKPARTRWLEVLLQRTADLAISRRRGVLWGAVFMILVGAFGISRIDADTYSIDYFRDSHPVRQDSEFIEEHFGPYTPLEFVVEVPEGGRSVALLGAIASWQDAMERDPDVGWTRSAVDVVRRLHQLLTDGRPESYVVPATDKGLEEALWVYQSDPDADLSDSVDSDWSRIRVTAGTRMMSARDIGEAIDRLVALADLPTDARIVPSGYVPLYVTMMDYVVRSQITSFAAAFVIIFALLALMYRSLRMAVLAVPANLFPLFLTLGLMGLAGIRLDVATVTIAAIVLGLVVDDTTHFLYRFRESLRVSGDHEAAVRESLRTTGVAMATTSIVLVAGFSVLVLATVKSVAAFGLLIAVALASALLGDLVVLPALLVTLRPRL